jgi:glutathione S-transferase
MHPCANWSGAFPRRHHVGWIEAQLGDGRPWMCGDVPSLRDINAHTNLW